MNPAHASITRKLRERTDAQAIHDMVEADALHTDKPTPERTRVYIWITSEVERRFPTAAKRVISRFDEEAKHFDNGGEPQRIDYVGTLLGELRAMDIIGDGDLTR